MKALTLFLLLPLTVLAEPATFIDPAEDARHFGDPEMTLFWTPQQQVAGYRNMDRLVHARWIRAGYIAAVGEKVSDYPQSDINEAGWSTLALYDYLDDKPRSRIR